MIKTLLKTLLAATALMPVAAMAQDGRPDRGDRGGFRAQRGGGGERPQRQERTAQPQAAPQQAAPQPQQQPQQARQFQRREGRPDVAGQRPEGQQFQRQQFRQERTDDRQAFRTERRDDRQALQNGQVTRPEFRADRQGDRQAFRADRQDDRRDFQQDRRNDGGAAARERLRQQYGHTDNDRRDQYRDQNRFNDRGGWNGSSNQGWNGARSGGWNRGWRNDNRYDYNRYRSSNRNVFHLPRYYAPYGWDGGYRRFSIGFSLNSILFGENYWIDDPWYYRLPPADGEYRWVRYYNDALLVDLETGEVVDTVYDIFW